MEAKGIATQIIIAGATAVVTTTVAVLVTSWLTKRSTTENIASGKQPLPPGSTPTTDGPPINVKPTGNPAPPPPPPPQPAPQVLNVAQVAQLAQSLAKANPCPPGYHSVPTGQPNFPYMCIQD
jgi:hypothetical protein